MERKSINTSLCNSVESPELLLLLIVIVYLERLEVFVFQLLNILGLAVLVLGFDIFELFDVFFVAISITLSDCSIVVSIFDLPPLAMIYYSKGC